jgi:uncharacterized protein HemX
MTELETRAPRRRWPWVLLLAALLLALLGGAGYGGWHLWHARAETEDTLAAQDTLIRRLSRQLGQTQSELEQLRERQSDLADGVHRNADGLAQLQDRLGDIEQTLARLSAALQGGRTRTQLVATEQLLLIANDRAQLLHDAPGAAVALQLAEDRLAALAEPRLFEVRKAVAGERAALLAVPQADRSGAALSLATLIEHAQALPLRDRPRREPSTVSANAEAVRRTNAERGGWARGWSSVREALAAVFLIRRSDQPVDRLLPPEQDALVLQLYALKLESARAALLQNQTVAFRSAVDSALAFLADYYRPEDPGVSAARAELERLRGLELDPPLPDLSRGLGLLRAYLDAMHQ